MLQKGQFFIECPGQPTVLEMLLQDPVLAAALSAKRARIERATNPRTVGAQVEVLQPEKGGLAGARYAAQVLATEI